LVPLFWDIQGCEQPTDLDYELFISVEDQAQRFEKFGVDVAQLEHMDTVRILRTLQRALRESNKQLFLLIDETEALINVALHDRQLIARLRKVFQNGGLRTVMMATKSLMRLNDLARDWDTSPFLFGVSLVNLWSLDPNASQDLVLQKQSDFEIEVDAELIGDILVHTHRHPYLIQYLCYRLFEPISESKGTLRPIQDEDLRPDQLLAGFLQIDFDHLAPMERQILLTVAHHGVIAEDALYTELKADRPDRIAMFTYGMNKLGYLRPVYGQWTLGNEFLRRWVMENYEQLSHAVQSQVSDQGVESLLMVGRQMERAYLQQELATQQRQLDLLLERRKGYGQDVPLALSTEIQNLRREISTLLEQLGQLEAASQYASG
jgi:hypothetical protein